MKNEKTTHLLLFEEESLLLSPDCKEFIGFMHELVTMRLLLTFFLVFLYTSFLLKILNPNCDISCEKKCKYACINMLT